MKVCLTILFSWLGEFAKMKKSYGNFILDCFSAPRIMAVFWLILLLQVAAGTIASFMVGMIWFSSYGLGRMWWSYTFPNKKYGECTGPAVGYG